MSDPQDIPAPNGLRETEIRLRNTMCEAAEGFDLDMHARHIAAEVIAARRRGRVDRSRMVGEAVADTVASANDNNLATAKRMEEERWRRRSQKRTDS